MYAIAIPKWGIEMENGTITNWHYEVGDTVTKGDELVDIEADKIVNTLEAVATGVLRRKLVETDETMAVGELIGVIADADVPDESIDTFVAHFNANTDQQDDSTPNDTAAAERVAAPASAAPPVETTPSGKVRVSPPVRRLAKKLGIEISEVVGSGPGGRITTEDVEKAAAGDSSKQTDASAGDDSSKQPFTVSKLNSTQLTIGKRLVESKQSVPHFYLSIDIELDGLIAKRADINSSQDQKVSINDMIVWATARALMAVPSINAQLVDDEIRQFEHADISVAVATERGLMTPIVAAAEQKTPEQIAATIGQLVDKAKSGGLQRNDIDGGSFTVSNLGMYGVNSFDAIINPPQVAILALGKAQKQMVVRDNDETAIATVISANLSSDHRVVDGALGGRFLSALKNEIESL